jgi:uncharacterized repeat protein (TIGR01451 family)
MEELTMSTKCSGARGALASAGLILLATIMVLGAGPAYANNGVNTPPVGGYTADMVRAEAQQQVFDPPLDVFGSGASCPDPVNYGFDYGDSVYVWLSPAGDLYFVVEINGNIGDSDQDGGYDTEGSSCGGHPGCVAAESDAFHNVFASGVESITYSIDRDCNGIYDLRFTLTGAGGMKADSVSVTLDAMTDFFGDILGGQGVAWAGAPLQPGPDAICVAERNSAVLVKIANWGQYFEDPVTHDPIPGILPNLFEWQVNSGNNSDSYTEDLVVGLFDTTNPQIDLQKSTSRNQLCGTGDTTVFTLTLTNTGNTPLYDVTLTDQLPTGLDYDNAYTDDPTNPIGSPTVVSDFLSWAPFDLEVGGVRVVSFQAVSNGCQGPVTNTTDVTAMFDADCLQSPVPLADQATASLTCVSPGVAVAAPPAQTLCAGSPWSVTFVVTNTSSVTEDLSIDVTVGGAPQPTVNRSAVAPGDTVHVGAAGTLPAVCGSPITVSCEATASIPGVDPQVCSDTDSDQTTVSCAAACVTVADAPPDTTCPGANSWLDFVVTNCNGQGGAENMTFSGMFNGSPTTVNPTSASNVADGDTVHVKLLAVLPAENCDPAGYLGVLTANAALVSDAECVDSDTGEGSAYCTDPEVDIVKSTSPVTTDSGSTVTITVNNPSSAVLDPVMVSDHLPAGLLFDAAQTIGGSCGASVDHVETVGDLTWIYFTGFSLDPGASCTITYDVDCGEFDNQARIDTAYVNAWCEGTFQTSEPVTASDTSMVICEREELCCWMTTGGFHNGGFRSGNKDDNFGGNVGPPPSGEWQHVQREGKKIVFNFHAHDVNVRSCGHDGTEGPCVPRAHSNWIVFGGTGAYNLGNGKREYAAYFTARAEDHGEPGRRGNQEGGCGTPDYYEIAVWDAVTNDVVFTASGLLDGGNIQIRDCKAKKNDELPPITDGNLTDNPGGLGFFETGEDLGLANLILRAYPNPVTRAPTRILFNVPSRLDGSQVNITVYDIAGREVRSLVSETMSAGQRTVNWDLRDASGIPVATGIYFYRLRVGTESLTQRIMVMR